VRSFSPLADLILVYKKQYLRLAAVPAREEDKTKQRTLAIYVARSHQENGHRPVENRV
jgi:hypothetical protein